MLAMIRSLELTSEVVLFIYSFIFVMDVSTLPQLILDKSCYQSSNNLTFCQEELVNNQTFQGITQKDASKWILYYFLCSATISLFAVIIFGTLSDILGYKVVMLMYPVFGGLQNVIFLLSAQYMSLPIWWVLIGGLFAGIYGDLQGVLSGCYGLVANVTKENAEKRTSRMLILEPLFFLANGLGGLVSGYLLQLYGYVSIYALCLSCHFLMFLYICFFIPGKKENKECKDSEEMTNLISSEHNSNASTVSKFFFHLKELWTATNAKTKLNFAYLLILYIPATSGILLETDLTALYLKNYPFNLNSIEIGYYFFMTGIIRAIGITILSLLVLHYSIADYWLLAIAFLSQAILYISMGIASSFVEVIIVTLFGAFVPVGVSIIRSMASKCVSSKYHGTVISIILFADVMLMIVLNFAVLGLYNLTLDFYSGFPYFTVAFIDICGLVMLYGTYKAL